MTEEALFHEALAKSPAERAAFLDQACAGRPQLRGAVAALLAAHAGPIGLLDAPPVDLGYTADIPTRRATPPAFSPVGADAPTAPGAVFAGRYLLQEKIGAGAMGVVYQARDLALKRLVALKLMRPEACDGPDALVRFRKEAEALARLKHQHIVEIHSVDEHEGRPYLVLELVAGGNLDRTLAGGPLPPRRAAALGLKLAWAVEHLHRHKIVHRDLKPANVLLTAEGEPKVTDFGLAKHLDGSRLTQSGAILGTPTYMAPEQVGGAAADQGPAADIHALGATLYEMLTGRPPFQGENVFEVLEQVRTHAPAPPRQINPEVPRDLEAICLTCLRKEPGDRYPSATDLAADLQNFLDGRPVKARAGGLGEMFGRLVRNVPLVLSAVFALLMGVALLRCLFSSVALLLALAAAVLIIWMVGQARPRPLLLGAAAGCLGGCGVLLAGAVFLASQGALAWGTLASDFGGALLSFLFLGSLGCGLTAGMIHRGPWPRSVILPACLGLVLIYFLIEPEGLHILIVLAVTALWFAGVGKVFAEYHGTLVWAPIVGSFGGMLACFPAIFVAGFFLHLLGVTPSVEMQLGLAGTAQAVGSILGARRAARNARSRAALDAHAGG